MCALLSASLGPALAGPPEAAAAVDSPSLCPARLPAQLDSSLWEGIDLSRGTNTRVAEIRWGPDQPQGPAGSVECHYYASDTHYWSHPVLRSVFKVLRPDPGSTPAWHPTYPGSDVYLCSGATEVVFDPADCPFSAIGRTRPRTGETELPF